MTERWRWLESTRKLQAESFGIDYENLEGDKLADYLLMNAYAAVCEIVESTDEANWKKWAENRGHVNRSAMIGEIVDGAHFLANTLCALGVTDEEWETRYQEKQQQNAVRQSASYDKNQDKCPRCRRELDKHGMLHLDVQDGIRCAGCSYRIGELMPSGEPNWDKHSGVIIKNAKFR